MTDKTDKGGANSGHVRNVSATERLRADASQKERKRLDYENDELRELVQSFHSAMLCTLDTGLWPTDPKWLEQRMRELGVEV